MGSGLGMKCTFDYEGSRGEVLVNGKKYHTTVQSQGQSAHSMSDGTNMYVWAEGQSEGIMITPEDLKEADAESQYGVFDTDKDYDFTCLPSVVSGNAFIPPSDLKFISIRQMFEGMFG